jgi:1-acyl-sn-glycerol-3-phosphate acyltransferase
LSDATNYLADGVPVAVFPEGQISPDGALLPMKAGFFKLAMQTGVPIVPLGMWGNQTAWIMEPPAADGTSIPSKFLDSADIHVHIGSPIDPAGLTLEELMAKVASEIDRLTKGLPNYSLDIYEHPLTQRDVSTSL